MEYISTRNSKKIFSFSETVLEGLAADGGLLIPKTLPDFSQQLGNLENLSYQQLANTLLIPFCEPCLSAKQIHRIVHQSYQNFTEPPLKLQHLSQHSILELFYGPTLSFKDYALQLLANFFEELLPKSEKMNILGATSGDTGSAAISAMANKKNLSIFTLFPKDKVSFVQKLQMTTVVAPNVYNLEIAGNFDDCQNIIKQIFTELPFKKKFRLGAINSINWARILGQITHYFYAGLLQKKAYPNQPLIFCVPTGNFGHIYAGLLAKKMGLPIEKLLLATNENDILTRLIHQGKYQVQEFVKTLSPAMDIQKASNFERYLYLLCKEDTKQVVSLMQKFQQTGEFTLQKEQRKKIAEDFLSDTATQEQVKQTIKKYYHNENYLLDTHTAVGISVAEKLSHSRTICFATAHPAKFYETIEKIINNKIELPFSVKQLFPKKQKLYEMKAQKEEIMSFIEKKLAKSV